jgi:hypothetical protein
VRRMDTGYFVGLAATLSDSKNTPLLPVGFAASGPVICRPCVLASARARRIEKNNGRRQHRNIDDRWPGLNLNRSEQTPVDGSFVPAVTPRPEGKYPSADQRSRLKPG